MELRRYVDLLRSRWLLIAGCALLGAIGGAFATRGESTYSARSTIYVGSRTIDDSPGSGQLSGDRNNAIATLALTFSKMIDSEPIAARAVALTGADVRPVDLVNRTAATLEPGTQLLYVTVLDEDPAQARDLANALAEGFVAAIQDFEPGTSPSEGAVPTLPAYVFERAPLPTTPVATGSVRSATIGLLLGLVVSIGVIVLIDALDVTVRDQDDAEEKLDLPVLGAIPLLGSELPKAPAGHLRERKLVRT